MVIHNYLLLCPSVVLSVIWLVIYLVWTGTRIVICTYIYSDSLIGRFFHTVAAIFLIETMKVLKFCIFLFRFSGHHHHHHHHDNCISFQKKEINAQQKCCFCRYNGQVTLFHLVCWINRCFQYLPGWDGTETRDSIIPLCQFLRLKLKSKRKDMIHHISCAVPAQHPQLAEMSSRKMM